MANGWTDQKIKGLSVPSGAPVRYFEDSADRELRGFGMQITRTGVRSWFVAYTSPTNHKRRTLTLGSYPAVSLADARKRCRAARALIGDGIDPIENREAEKEAEAAERAREAARGTVGDLFPVYLRALKRDGKDRTAAEVSSIYDRDIGPVIGEMKARDVSPDDIAGILARILNRAQKRGRSGVYAANRTRTYLRAAFQLGRSRKRRGSTQSEEKRFDLHSNPVDETEPEAGERPRDRFLGPDELRTVWMGLAEPYRHEVTVATRGGGVRKQVQTFHTDPLIGLALRWLLATGQRVEEALGATWGEIDEEERLWVIPAERRKNRSKNRSGEPHLVPLTDLHLALLREIKERRVDASPWLFFSPRDPKKPMGHRTLSQAIRRYCERMGLEPFQPKDLRRTFKTLAGQGGLGLEVRNRLQGHAMQDIGSRHYDRWEYLPEKRAAMERWSLWLERVLNPEPAVVVPMGRVHACA